MSESVLPQGYEPYLVIGVVILVAAIALQGAQPFIWIVGILIVAAAATGGWMMGKELTPDVETQPVTLLSNGPVDERTPELNPVISEKELPTGSMAPDKWQVSLPGTEAHYTHLQESIDTLKNQHKNNKAFMGGYHVVHPPAEAVSTFMRTSIIHPGNHLRKSIHEDRQSIGPRLPKIGSTRDLIRKRAYASLQASHQGGRLPQNYQTI